MLHDHDTIKYSIFGEYNYTSAKIIDWPRRICNHVHNTLILHSVTLEHYRHCHDCESLILLQSLLFMLMHNCDTNHYIYGTVMIMHI